MDSGSSSVSLTKSSSSMDSGKQQQHEKTTTTVVRRRFDVVTPVPVPANHHYYYARNPRATQDAAVHKHIMKELRILRSSQLPDGIHVQAYQSRIYLLRAAIVGPPGTPYHDALFFFDIALLLDYPNTPPQVHFHSYDYRLNPDLYANGSVWLNLKNTWSKRSTLLQLLLLIQELVLNGRPYFNVPETKLAHLSLKEQALVHNVAKTAVLRQLK